MRTVVLPQGQFSEFLKLKNAERRSMLQRIFHLEQYGLELTQKISSAKQKQELLLSNLEGQLQGYENVSGDSLNKMRQSHALLKEELKKTAEKKEAARQAFQEADAIRSLLLEYDRSAKNMRTACGGSRHGRKREAAGSWKTGRPGPPFCAAGRKKRPGGKTGRTSLRGYTKTVERTTGHLRKHTKRKRSTFRKIFCTAAGTHTKGAGFQKRHGAQPLHQKLERQPEGNGNAAGRKISKN